MHRFFADERGIVQDAAYLNAEDAGHALRALRLESGDEVELVCAPARYRAKIDSTEGGEVRLRVIEKLRDTEAKTRVTLYQGLPKADKMELIVQKSTELGAAAIAPVAMIRSVVKLEGKDAAKKTERWQKIAREAVKQCARVSAPEVRLPRKLSAMREELNALDVLIVPWEDARGYSLTAFHREHPEIRDLAIVIGPEGGMSADEIARMKDCGCQSVTLGARILRTETAGLCALSALFCLYGELE